MEPCIPANLTADDFINFFINNIETIRDQIHHLLPTMGITLYSAETLDSAVPTGSYLDCFSPIIC